METQHIFKLGDKAFTIWGEEVVLEADMYRDNVLTFFSQKDECSFWVNKNGESALGKILYPYPVKVIPVPEFEEGEEIEGSEFSDFRSFLSGEFRGKDSSGYFIIESEYGDLHQSQFARKIQKPVKTKEELKNELIDKQSMLLDLLLEYQHTKEDLVKHKELKSEIQSLKEQ